MSFRTGLKPESFLVRSTRVSNPGESWAPRAMTIASPLMRFPSTQLSEEADDKIRRHAEPA